MNKKFYNLYLACYVKPCHPGLEVIKLELILRLKIKRNDWLLAEQPLIALYFDFETVLKFYNIEARVYPHLKVF